MQNGVQTPLHSPRKEPLRTEPSATPPAGAQPAARPVEIGGRTGPEPTRYGDWEKNGRCIDF